MLPAISFKLIILSRKVKPILQFASLLPVTFSVLYSSPNLIILGSTYCYMQHFYLNTPFSKLLCMEGLKQLGWCVEIMVIAYITSKNHILICRSQSTQLYQFCGTFVSCHSIHKIQSSRCCGMSCSLKWILAWMFCIKNVTKGSKGRHSYYSREIFQVLEKSWPGSLRWYRKKLAHRNLEKILF